MTKILIIGATGMLGSSIMLSKTLDDLWGTYLGGKPKSRKILELDITDSQQVRSVIKEVSPAAIIHTAAITDVDLCENKPDFAQKVHVMGTKNLLSLAQELKSYFIYISTDAVFDGKEGNYAENHQVNPLNVYAKTKYEGEKITAKYNFSSVIRTNIYGFNWLPKKSIAEWILSTLRAGEKIDLFKDVLFSPILVNDLTEILLQLVHRELRGLYHVAGANSVTKLSFGMKIAEIFELSLNLINQVSISDQKFKAPRPLNPTLNCSKIQKSLGQLLPTVEAGLLHFKNLEINGYPNRLKEL